MATTNGTGVKEESVKEQRFRRRLEARTEAQRRRSNHDRLLTEFQPDAVEIEKQPVAGGARFTLYAIMGLIASFIFWANWAQVDKIVTAQGSLLTTEGPVVIDTKLTSPINTLNFKFGDKVEAGEVLATLDPTFSKADLEALEIRKKSLMANLARLHAEKENKEFSFEGHESDRDWIVQYRLFVERKIQYSSEMRKFDAKQTALDVQMQNTKLQIKGQLDQYARYKGYENGIKKLSRSGSKSSTDVLSSELQSTDAEMQVLASKAKLRELEKSKESVAADREAYIAGWRTEIVAEFATANETLNGLEQERTKAIRSNEFVELKVPNHLPYKEFMVLEMADKTVGSTMQPGEPLCKLVPVGVPMEVEVDIEGKDIGIIQAATAEQIASGDLPAGSEVRVKLASFPYQKHGTLDGVVRAISEGSFEKEMPNGAMMGVTTYKARVQLLDSSQLEEVGEHFRLMPGMAATCEIKVGKRKVIEYFLYPLLRYMDKSIREP